MVAPFGVHVVMQMANFSIPNSAIVCLRGATPASACFNFFRVESDESVMCVIIANS